MQQVLARKNVQKTKFEAAEMILEPWNQQYTFMESDSEARMAKLTAANQKPLTL